MKPNHPAKPKRPTDPYDGPAWAEFYAAHPGMRRSLSAAAPEDSSDPDPTQAEEKQPSDPTPPKDPDAKPAQAGADDKPKVSDKEAELLKEVMKHKGAKKEVEAQLAELSKKLEGVDLDEYRKIKSEQEQAAEQRLIDKGEFDKVKSQILSQHETKVAELGEQISGKDATIAELQNQLNELTIGASFDTSETVKQTVYTPRKARVLFGAHFDLVDGKVVGYDAPRGKAGRAPIVDGTGEPAGFEVAMKRIIEADPEKDEIFRTTMRPGADSGSSRNADSDKGAAPKKPMTSHDKIAAGIGDMVKNMGSDSGPGFKLG